jgi:hypothetical protein
MEKKKRTVQLTVEHEELISAVQVQYGCKSFTEAHRLMLNLFKNQLMGTNASSKRTNMRILELENRLDQLGGNLENFIDNQEEISKKLSTLTAAVKLFKRKMGGE